jgi:hypothetical protein
MGIGTSIGNVKTPKGKVYPSDLSDGLRKHRYAYWEHGMPALQFHNVVATGLATITTGVATETDQILLLPGGLVLERYNGTTQDLGVIWNALGLDISGDQTSNDIVQYVPGGNYAANPYAFTTGTSRTSFFRVRVYITDVSGLDNCFFGWRKQEAWGAMTVKSATDPVYTEFVGFGLPEGATAGLVYIVSDVADSGTPTLTSTAFNPGDLGYVDFEVRLTNRTAKFFINGTKVGDTVSKNSEGTAITAQPTVNVASPTLTTATKMIPTIVLQQTTDFSPVYLRQIEIGQLIETGLDGNNRV